MVMIQDRIMIIASEAKVEKNGEIQSKNRRIGMAL